MLFVTLKQHYKLREKRMTSIVRPSSISDFCKRLSSCQTIGIEVGLLANSHSAVTCPDAEARIVEDRRMIDGAIVPYSYGE